MPRLVLAIFVAGSILVGGAQAFAMGGGGGRHHSGGGSSGSSYGPNTTTYYASDRPVYTTPEPGTIALLGTGAGAVGLLTWLRRRR
jgi:hypothetical protein